MGTNARRPITSEHLAALKEHGLWTEELAKKVWLASQRDPPELRQQARKSSIDEIVAWAQEPGRGKEQPALAGPKDRKGGTDGTQARASDPMLAPPDKPAEWIGP